MGLKELLTARAVPVCNLCNRVTSGEVTEITVSNQRCNLCNRCNLTKEESADETAEAGTAAGENCLTRPLLSEVTEVTQVTALKTKEESCNLTGTAEVTSGKRCPASDVAPSPDDPGDDGLDWAGEVEPEPEPEPEWRRPRPLPETSLVAALVAAGATVRTWSDRRGGKASIEAPAGIPAELVHEIDARGWRIIPGGRANPEAEHDSWLAGVPIAEFDP